MVEKLGCRRPPGSIDAPADSATSVPDAGGEAPPPQEQQQRPRGPLGSTPAWLISLSLRDPTET